MLNNEIISGIEQLSNSDNHRGLIFNIELGHSPVGVNLHGEPQYGMLKNGIRIIEEGLIESIIQGLHIGRMLRRNFNRKVHLVVSLSDLHGVSHEERLLLKNLVKDIEFPLIDIFCKYGVSEELILDFESGIKLGSVIFQSDGTSKIRSKISKLLHHFKKVGPKNFYEEYGFIIYEVKIGDYYGITLFSSECFFNDILKQGIPLLFGEEKNNMSTQCGPTVTGIQQEILGNDKLNRIITIDNPKDTSIRTKSIRGQLLLKLLYGKDSSFITPESYGNNSYLGPINSGRKLEFDELLKLSLESLLNSGYDEVQILGDSNLLINSGDNLNPSCNLGICNI